MDSIINYTFKEFLKKPKKTVEEYLDYLKFLPAKETKKQVMELTLRQVDFIKTNLTGTNEDLVEIISYCQSIELEEVYKLKILDFFAYYNSIKEQIERIIKAEQYTFENEEVDPLWERVRGSERLSKFKIYNTLEQLSKGDILKWSAIMDLPYSDVFVKLRIDKENSQIKKEIEQLQINKNR